MILRRSPTRSSASSRTATRRSASAPAPGAPATSGGSRRRSTPRGSRRSSLASYTERVREQVKQLLKNSVYRAIGETTRGLGAVNGDGRTLRVLMYHKVNDVAGNRMSMPVSHFDEQMAQLRELGYVAVDLDAVLAHYVDGVPLP